MERVAKATVCETHRTYSIEFDKRPPRHYSARKSVIQVKPVEKKLQQPVAKKKNVLYNIYVEMKHTFTQVYRNKKLKRRRAKQMETNTKFLEAKIKAETLSELYDSLVSKEKAVHHTWGKIEGESYQDTDHTTGEPLWEDEAKTIPKMRDKYDYVEKDELSEEDNIRIKVYHKLMKDLEGLLK